MPCLLVALALIVPRVTMFFIWLLTTWFSQALESAIWPILGFFFLPYTTLAYMAAMLNNSHQVSGLWLILVIIAVVVDLGGHGAGAKQGRRSSRP